MEVAEDCLEEGAVGGVPRILKPQEEQLHPETTDLDSISGLLQQCVRFQWDMSDRWERESIKQDQRWCQMQIQMNNLRDEMEQQQSAVGRPQEPSPPQQQLREEMVIPPSVTRDREGRSWRKAVIPKLEVGDNIKQYLITFERLVVAYQWPKVEWVVRLVPYLSGRA